MSLIETRKCDGPGCKNQIDLIKMGNPTYHQLIIGGSDFEMSFSGEPEYCDFCCFDCLRRWLECNIDRVPEGTVIE